MSDWVTVVAAAIGVSGVTIGASLERVFRREERMWQERRDVYVEFAEFVRQANLEGDSQAPMAHRPDWRHYLELSNRLMLFGSHRVNALRRDWGSARNAYVMAVQTARRAVPDESVEAEPWMPGAAATSPDSKKISDTWIEYLIATKRITDRMRDELSHSAVVRGVLRSCRWIIRCWRGTARWIRNRFGRSVVELATASSTDEMSGEAIGPDDKYQAADAGSAQQSMERDTEEQ